MLADDHGRAAPAARRRAVDAPAHLAALFCWHLSSLVALALVWPHRPLVAAAVAPAMPDCPRNTFDLWLLSQRRLRRSADARNQSVCLVFADDSSAALCNVSAFERIAEARKLSLFANCPPDRNVQLSELFILPRRRRLTDRTDVHEWARWNHLSADGLACLSDDDGDCHACFDNISRLLRRVDHAFTDFNDTVLTRFDCTFSTERFSSNSSCAHCQAWYRHWLLAHEVRVWRWRLCPRWCHYAELACPHIATRESVDYAGLPSFRCTDPNIRPFVAHSYSDCCCIDPCDMLAAADGQDAISRSLRCDTHRRLCGANRTLSCDADWPTAPTTTSGGARQPSPWTAALASVAALLAQRQLLSRGPP